MFEVGRINESRILFFSLYKSKGLKRQWEQILYLLNKAGPNSKMYILCRFRRVLNKRSESVLLKFCLKDRI